MPTQVSYDGARLIPAPEVNIVKAYQKSAENQIVGSLFNITITGVILAFKGSPLSNGTFYTGSTYPADESVADISRLESVLKKQQAIRDLFKNEGRQLVIQSADGSAPMKCNPRVNAIDFPNENWYQEFHYSIQLETDAIYLAGGSAFGEDGFTNIISSADESWTFDTDDTAEGIGLSRTYRVSHSISAIGKRFYDNAGTLVKDAWKQAQDYVLPKLGFDATIALSSGVNNLPSYYGGYNYVRNEQIGRRSGSYSVIETFILTSGTAIEDFSVSTRQALDTGINTVSIDGTVTGLEVRNSNFNITSFKYDNAVAKFSGVQSLLTTRALQYSAIPNLNFNPVNFTIGRNPLTGVISYSYEYNDRPSNLFASAKSEVINVSDNWGEDVSADIFVLGRTLGPVIQNLGAHKVRMRNLSIELVMPISSGTVTDRFYTNKPSILPATSAVLQSVVNSFNPISFGATKVNVESQNTSWDSQRFSYNVSWKFELNQNTIV